MVRYSFSVAVMEANTLIAHIFHNDCKDISHTVLLLYHCVMEIYKLDLEPENKN